MRRILTAIVGIAVSVPLIAVAPASATASAAGNRIVGSSAGSGPGAVRTVLLPTGDAVVLRTVAGRPSATIHAAQHSGPEGSFLTEHLGGHTYVFPAEARPFLGTVLDPSLFDVTTLATVATATRIPVTVTAAAGATISIPGFTTTSRSGSVRTGYLATSAASALRQVLLAAARRTSTTPGAPSSPFAGVTHIALTGAVAPAKPAFPQVTLIIKALDAKGKPASEAFVGLVNTDDARKYEGFVFAVNGEARVSVPLGHYSGLADVSSFSPTSFSDRLVPVGDYTVAKNLQALTFDARKATVRPTVHTPLPGDLSSLTLELDRDTAQGGIGSSFLYGPGADVFIAPTSTVRYGSLYWLTTWSLLGSPASGSDYSYDLSFLDEGSVPVDESHTVAAFQLATVHGRYYTDQRTQGLFVRSPLYPFQFGGFSLFEPLNLPTARTEYIYAPPTAVWYDQMVEFASGDEFGGFVFDDPRFYHPGSVRNADWLRGPLAPSVPAQTNGDTFYVCPACRTATKLSVFLAPVTDTTPGHSGFLDELEKGPPVAHFAIYRDGTKIGGGPDLAGGEFTVPAGAATYRIHDTTDRTADPVITSTTTSTDLTFTSSSTSGAGVPTGWYCGIGSATACTVLPLLHATVPLPTSLTDALPVGATTFDFTIARNQGAAPATVTAATFATSADGRTFHTVPVTALGGGVFRATVVNPQSTAGHAISVRVTGADSGGSTISQTVTSAYLVAAD